MKRNAKRLMLVVTGCLLIAAARHMQAQNSAEPDDVPEKYRDTVRKGLEYLVAHQSEDGHWEGTDGKQPVATTALAGIALLMNGSGAKSKYAANLRKAADWLMSKSQAQREGLIYSGHPSETDRYLDGHGLATQFLAWMARDEPDQARNKKLHDVVGRAVAYIVKAQSIHGGWYRTSKAEGHDFARISSTAIQYQALQMAVTIGIGAGGNVSIDAQAYLQTEIGKQPKESKSAQNPRQAADLAAALVCRADPNSFFDADGVATEWFKHCRTMIPMGRDVKFGRDELAHLAYAQALYNAKLNDNSKAAAWNDYRQTMFDFLRSSQAKGGSWSAAGDFADPQGISAGPIYSTAVWCVVLQFDKGSHPLTRRVELMTL
jgi:Squalene-hopene cyclase C-terminal domain